MTCHWQPQNLLCFSEIDVLTLSDCLSHRHTITYSLCHRLHDVKSRAESPHSLTNHKQLIEHGAHGNTAPSGLED